MNWPDCVPTLIDESRGLVLRALTEADLPAVVEACQDPDTVKWTTVPQPYDHADAVGFLQLVRQGWEDGSLLSWAVEAERNGVRQWCGTVELRLSSHGRGEIAFSLHPGARGKRLLSNAARMMLDWAYHHRGVEVVLWRAIVGNWESRRVANALGFRFEGVRRGQGVQRGVRRDEWAATRLLSEPEVNFNPPPLPEVTGEGVLLRAFDERDLPRIVEAMNDQDSRRWLPEIPLPYGQEQAQEFINWSREGEIGGTLWNWCVTTPDDETCLGAVTLFRLAAHNLQGELGYWLHPDARRQGLASAAVRAAADFILNQNVRKSLLVRTAADNNASARVAWAAGFEPVGREPWAERLRDGTLVDLQVHARTQ